MNRTRMLALLAGAAMGAGVASAQTAGNAALERELLADAGARASFQAGGTAGHDGSAFFLGSADGNNRLEIGGYTQFRLTNNFRDSTAPDEDYTKGFDMPIAALEFGGNVINPQLSFYLRGYFDTEDSGGSFELADAYGSYTLDNGLTITWGQFLAPVIRERIVDERHQLAVARSVVSGVFSPEYTQGVAMSYTSDNFRLITSTNDGAGTANTSYYSAAEADWALTGRVEFKWSGDWAQFEDFTSWRGTEGYAGMFGAAVHWQTSGDQASSATFPPGGVAPTDVDIFLYSADVSVEGDGWNFFGAFVGRTIDPDAGSSTDDFGAIIQGGFFVTDQFELFGRWDAVFPDDSGSSSDDSFNTATFGGNYYFITGSHAAKFTGDISYNFEDQTSLTSTTGFGSPDSYTGTLPSEDDGQWMLRLQMQLVF